MNCLFQINKLITVAKLYSCVFMMQTRTYLTFTVFCLCSVQQQYVSGCSTLSGFRKHLAKQTRLSTYKAVNRGLVYK